MSDNQTTGKAWAAIDRRAVLGRAVRECARDLLRNAQSGITEDGYVCVRVVDFEALTAALDREDDAYAWLERATGIGRKSFESPGHGALTWETARR